MVTCAVHRAGSQANDKILLGKNWVKRLNAMGTSLQPQLSRPMGRAKAEAQAVHPQIGTLQTDSIENNPFFEPNNAHHVSQKPIRLEAVSMRFATPTKPGCLHTRNWTVWATML